LETADYKPDHVTRRRTACLSHPHGRPNASQAGFVRNGGMNDRNSRFNYYRHYAFVGEVIRGWSYDELIGILRFMMVNDQGREGHWGTIDAVADEARRLRGSEWLNILGR
jgi:hypothetical protein